MKALFTFAGQGAQRPGMLADLPDSAAVQATLAEAADVLDRDTAGWIRPRRWPTPRRSRSP